jgi:hypothetical protein
MEPEGSLPCSQQPTTDPHTNKSTTSHPTSQRSTLILPSHLRLGLPSALPFRFCEQDFTCIYNLSHAWYMPRPSAHCSFVTKCYFTVNCRLLPQPSSWRATPCRSSATAYPIYSQIHPASRDHSRHPQEEIWKIPQMTIICEYFTKLCADTASLVLAQKESSSLQNEMNP